MAPRISIAIALVLSTGVAMADRVSTNARWNGWEIATGENLWSGQRHTSYPIWQMFDGDPRTAWVYSGVFSNADEDDGGPKKLRPLRDRYWIQLTPSSGTLVDEIRLMNGYNKDSKTFGRNGRITKIEVFANPSYDMLGHRSGVDAAQRRSLGIFTLKDGMGWQSIKIPSRKYESLRIEAVGLHRGTDPDVALSEMSLLYKGQEVGPGKPSLIVYNPGDDCGCGSSDKLRSPSGHIYATSDVEGTGIVASPDARYYAGTTVTSYRDPSNLEILVWIFDSKKDAFVWSRKFPGRKYPYIGFDEKNRLCEVTFDDKFRSVPLKVLWRPSDNSAPTRP